MHKLISTLLCTSLLAGCSFAPTYRPPSLHVRPAYTDADASQGADNPSRIAWQDYFEDPRLRVHLAAALANNRDLAVAWARVSEARARYRIQNAARLPQIDVNGGATSNKTPLASFGQTGSIDYDLYQVNGGVSAFELDLWGRVRNLSEAGRASYLASFEGAQAFRLSLIGSVAATYLQLRAGEEQIALARRTMESRREGVEIARLRMDAGVTSTADYDQAVTLLTQARTELADVQRRTEQTANFLEVLVGGPIKEPLPDGRSINDQAQFAAISPGLPSTLLVSRPDIRQAEQQLRAANANIGAARAAFFPTISLTGNFGFNSGELDDLFKGSTKAWSFGGLLNLPIFDGGGRQAELGVAKALRDQAVATYQKAVQEAFREVSDALTGRRRYRQQIESQEVAVAAQKRLAETARLRYDNGIALYLEVLDAERNLFSAEQALLALRSAELQNAVFLFIALGGGSLEKIEIIAPTAGSDPER